MFVFNMTSHTQSWRIHRRYGDLRLTRTTTAILSFMDSDSDTGRIYIYAHVHTHIYIGQSRHSVRKTALYNQTRLDHWLIRLKKWIIMVWGSVYSVYSFISCSLRRVPNRNTRKRSGYGHLLLIGWNYLTRTYTAHSYSICFLYNMDRVRGRPLILVVVQWPAGVNSEWIHRGLTTGCTRWCQQTRCKGYCNLYPFRLYLTVKWRSRATERRRNRRVGWARIQQSASSN